MFAPIAACPVCALLAPLDALKRVFAEIPTVSMIFVISAAQVITMLPVALAIVIVLPDTAEAEMSVPPIVTVIAPSFLYVPVGESVVV